MLGRSIRIIVYMRQQTSIKEGDELIGLMNVIDPSGTLVPGTDAYDTIRCLLNGWIRQYGYSRALCMARICRKRIGRWRKIL